MYKYCEMFQFYKSMWQSQTKQYVEQGKKADCIPPLSVRSRQGVLHMHMLVGLQYKLFNRYL